MRERERERERRERERERSFFMSMCNFYELSTYTMHSNTHTHAVGTVLPVTDFVIDRVFVFPQCLPAY